MMMPPFDLVSSSTRRRQDGLSSGMEALVDGTIDLAVHSMKDVPAALRGGLVIGAIPRREDPRDVLVSHTKDLDALAPGARIGTASVRRRAQLLARRRDLDVVMLRGNVDTRLRRWRRGLRRDRPRRGGSSPARHRRARRAPARDRGDVAGGGAGGAGARMPRRRCGGARRAGDTRRSGVRADGRRGAGVPPRYRRRLQYAARRARGVCGRSRAAPGAGERPGRDAVARGRVRGAGGRCRGARAMLAERLLAAGGAVLGR